MTCLTGCASLWKMEDEPANSEALEERLEREEHSVRRSLLEMMLRVLDMNPRGLNGFDEDQMNELKEFVIKFSKYVAICAALTMEPFLGVPIWLVSQTFQMVVLAWEQRVMSPVHVVNSDTSCTICFEGFEVEEEEKRGQAQALGCGHIYHKKCILDWLERNLSCPLCRFQVSDAF